MARNFSSKIMSVGYIPLPAWLILTTIAGFFAQDYNPIASHVSVMTLQDNFAHFLANMAALISGTAIILFGLGLWRYSNRFFSGGSFCWILFGGSMVANGVWPMGGPMHGLYIIGIFNVLAPALAMMDVKNQALRDRLYGITVFVSLSAVLYLWILLNGFDPDGYSGLTQRVFGIINLVWPLAFVFHLSRGIRES
ncbi:MAG: DUF998 domain-containing protein [Pseudomonadota bacterium]